MATDNTDTTATASFFAVFDAVSESWLQDDERSWGGWNGAAGFTDAKLAKDIGDREAKDGQSLIVMGIFGKVDI